MIMDLKKEVLPPRPAPPEPRDFESVAPRRDLATHFIVIVAFCAAVVVEMLIRGTL